MNLFQRYPISTYLLLLVIFSSGPYAMMVMAGSAESDLAMFLVMWAPALSAVAHRLFMKQPVFQSAGWNPVLSWKWMLAALFIPLVISVLVVCVQAGLGFVTYNDSFIRFENGLVHVRGIAMIFGAKAQPVWLFIFNFILSYLVGNVMYMLMFALGEEYGWRFHLQSLLAKRFSFIVSLLLLGIIWGLWHLPAIILGHNYPEYPILGGLVLMPLTCIAFSIVFGTGYNRSRALWVPVLFHSSLNLSAGMDDKMIVAKLSVFSADLVWTSVWALFALIFYFLFIRNHKVV